MTDLGELHYFLRLEVKQVEDGIFVSKKKYAANLLKRFNILGCKIVATLMNLNEKLQVNDGTEPADARSFRSLVGGLIYLINTQPDISVRVISRFMHCPSKHHFGADRRSTSSYVFSLGSTIVCWSSKKQTTTALSSSEAEYTAASSSAC
ncbi:uncharacterized mitochondrial protein AtMg00810-like [Hevea brasiliensis]|uniref:uncharacterized mitochondrial protein AtMg00810-like n=1 Tax=Hevea brasiliensis TaxID=3981 RepID=UPI0025CDFD24|nr:uncharacterized mitochondrial protein AtMg00810-like [Hevea brasiliensis]